MIQRPRTNPRWRRGWLTALAFALAAASTPSPARLLAPPEDRADPRPLSAEEAADLERARQDDALGDVRAGAGPGGTLNLTFVTVGIITLLILVVFGGVTKEDPERQEEIRQPGDR